MNKILAALNHSSVQIGAAERGSRKDALHLLNKVKKGIESSDCPQDIKEWFATALSQILEGESADKAFGLTNKKGAGKKLSEEEEEELYETFKDKKGKHHTAATNNPSITTYATIAKDFGISPNQARKIIKDFAITEESIREALED